jgi:hypothetical protein
MNQEKSDLRKTFYETLTSQAGKNIYQKVANAALSSLGAEDHQVQIIPTPRVHFPGARSASFHTDGWYGHSQGTRTIWMS